MVCQGEDGTGEAAKVKHGPAVPGSPRGWSRPPLGWGEERKGRNKCGGGDGKVRLGTKVKREEEEGGEIAKVEGKRI